MSKETDSDGSRSADIGKMRLSEALEEKDYDNLPLDIARNLRNRANELAGLFRSQWLEGDIPILASEFFIDFKLAFHAGVVHGKRQEAEDQMQPDEPEEEGQIPSILQRLRRVETLYASLEKKLQTKQGRYSIERRTS